jgi:rare lipoprotein A
MTQQYSIFRPLAAFAILTCAISQAHARVPATGPDTADHAPGWIGETGVASWYGAAYHGRRAADGSRFDQRQLTAAHAWLPFGTRVRVTLGNTGHSVIVVITDRLYSKRRVVDLSHSAARQLGIVDRGVATVSLSPA